MTTPIEARMSLAWADGSGTPDWLMYMPGGTHTITASTKGKPVTLTVTVDKDTAEVLQKDLTELRAGKQKPFFDFDHRREGASAWPVEFAWRNKPEPGVWCRVEWSKAGVDAVSGKIYRSFSPSFFVEDGKVVGASLCMGSLVNDPAFTEMAPIWSRRVHNKTEGTEEDMETSATELAAKNSRIAELEQKVTELQAEAASEELKGAVEAATSEAEALKVEIKKLKEESAARKNRDADLVVASAVARGVIPVKDEDGKKRWRDLIIADANNADLLAKMPGKVALDGTKITSPARKSEVQLVQADTNDILRAYINAATPRDKGLIYANELSGRIAKGENVLARYPVDAVNNLGTLANALVSQRVLELVVSKRPMLRGVVTDFSDEVKSKGDTVKTRTIGLPVAEEFGTAATATADTDVTVTLDLFKQVLYSFTAQELVGTSRNLVAERSEALAIALGNSMVDALAALITEANFGTANQTIQATAGISFDTIVAINLAMNVAGVPDMGRFGWVNSAVAAALSNDQLVTEYIDRSPIATAYARWQNIKGFENIWEFPALPANAVNLTGFFASRSALIVAARIPRNPSEIVGASYPGTMQVVTDPVSGYSVLRNEWIDGSSWAVNSRLVTLYGVDLGNAAVGHTLVSAA